MVSTTTTMRIMLIAIAAGSLVLSLLPNQMLHLMYHPFDHTMAACIHESSNRVSKMIYSAMPSAVPLLAIPSIMTYIDDGNPL